MCICKAENWYSIACITSALRGAMFLKPGTYFGRKIPFLGRKHTGTVFKYSLNDALCFSILCFQS